MLLANQFRELLAAPLRVVTRLKKLVQIIPQKRKKVNTRGLPGLQASGLGEAAFGLEENFSGLGETVFGLEENGLIIYNKLYVVFPAPRRFPQGGVPHFYRERENERIYVQAYV